MLKGFDPYKKWFILTGLACGFRIPKKHPSMWPFVGNYQQRNFTQYERIEIAQTIIKWLQMGVVYEVKNSSHVHLQPIYAIPKGSRTQPRGCRLIVHNSYPDGTSVKISSRIVLKNVHYQRSNKLCNGYKIWERMDG